LVLSSWKVRLTGQAYLRFLQEELPRLLEDVPLNKRGSMYLQHDGAPPRPRRRWEDNIKIDLQKVGCEGMDWIDLAQDGDRWWALVNAVMNLRVP